MENRIRGRGRIPRPRRRRRFAAAAVLLSTALCGGGAAESAEGLGERFELYPDLHTVRVPLENRDDLDPALARAMRQMLVRATGLRRPEESPGVLEALNDPESFVQQYLFESDPDLGLTVKFDEAAVAGIVERLELGWWSRIRPLVILWLAVEDEQGRKSYVDSAFPAAEVIDETARERGLPVLLPLFDIQDRIALPVSTLWGGFPEPIRRASDRYAADAILAGRAYQDHMGRWRARWTLIRDTDDEFRTSGEHLETVVSEGIHRLADRFAEQFARRGEAAVPVRAPITITGVEQLEDYARVLRYFASLDVVEEVQVVRIEGSHVRLVLRTKGGFPALTELIAFGRTLVPETEEGGEAGRGGESEEGVEGTPAAVYRLR